jgi:hypothetical protein
MSMRENQLTVPLDADTRRRLEEAAEREHRTVAGLARHLLVEAMAPAQQERAA